MSLEDVYHYYKDQQIDEYSPSRFGIVGGVEICDSNFNKYCEYIGAALGDDYKIDADDIDSILVDSDKIIVTGSGKAKSLGASTLDNNLVKLFNDVEFHPERELELPAPPPRQPSVPLDAHETDEILAHCPKVGGAAEIFVPVDISSTDISSFFI